jgi:hypothetical protein
MKKFFNVGDSVKTGNGEIHKIKSISVSKTKIIYTLDNNLKYSTNQLFEVKPVGRV